MQSILQSIVSYCCSHFILPKKVIKIFEGKGNAFLWTGQSDSPNGAKVWKQFVYLKKMVDWGVKGLRNGTKPTYPNLSGLYSLGLTHHGLVGFKVIF